MRLRYRIAAGALLLVTAGLIVLLAAMSYDAPCESTARVQTSAPSMKAAVRRCYGPPEVIVLGETARPTPADDEVLVRVRAASVNPLDWHALRGEPYFLRLDEGLGSPENPRLGVDFAGVVEAVGRNVSSFRPGEEVFGGSWGSLAQYVVVRAGRTIAPKPQNVTFEQAAAVPVAALTALQALRDFGGVRAGQTVLINGASGGVGTFAVQIAKALGAEVTGVCSTRNLEMVRSIGADHVLDYTREDLTQSGRRYDVIIDNVSTHSLLEYRRVLQSDGILVIVGSIGRGPWIGPMMQPIESLMQAPFVSQRATMFLARLNPQDLRFVADLMQSGKVTPVIDRVFDFDEVPEAIRYLEQGHARGKVVIAFR